MVAAASPTIVFRNSQRIVSLVTHLQTREFQDAKYVFGVWKMCPENASSEVRRKLLQLTEGFLEKTMGQGASRGWFAAASEAVNVLFALAQRFDVVAERLLWRVAREVFVDGGDGDDDDHSNATTENNNSNGNDVSDHANNIPHDHNDIPHDHNDITHDQEIITSNHSNITNDPNITNSHNNNSNDHNNITNDHNNNSNDHNNITNDPNITNNQSNTTHHPTNTPSETAAESPSLPLNPTEASLARFLFLLGQVALKLLQFTEQVATQAKRLRHRREEEERQKKAVANSMGLVTVSDDIEEEEMERISASEIVVK